MTTILSSTLQRAKKTAQRLHTAQKQPELTFIESELLKEQNFGIAEGKAAEWVSGGQVDVDPQLLYAQGVFRRPQGRSAKFPEGESSDDLARRADRAVNELFMPIIWKAFREGSRQHVAVVSHGLFIGEAIFALLRIQQSGNGLARAGTYVGLRNTAWSRILVTAPVEHAAKIRLQGLNLSQDWSEGYPSDEQELPELRMQVIDTNNHEHLDNLVSNATYKLSGSNVKSCFQRRQRGIGRIAHDEKQKDIRSFFGGGGEPSSR